MLLCLEPQLVEDLIIKEVARQEQTLETGRYKKYHRLTNSIYKRASIKERDKEFKKLHKELFVEWGFSDLIMEAIKEHPLLLREVKTVMVSVALTTHEEGADLSPQDTSNLGVKLMAERFFEPLILKRLLRHELTHISDLLDEAFGYQGARDFKSSSPAEENIVRTRYRLLWDIYVDSRLTREGRETIASFEERYREFEAQFLKLPPSIRRSIFQSLWDEENITHGQLLEMARQPELLLSRADGDGIEAPPQEQREKLILPGALCPLCRFPTYHWVERLEELPKEVIDGIKEDFPQWSLSDGVCERCIEIYKIRAGCW